MYNYYFGRGWKRYLPYLGMFPALALYLIFGVGPSFFTALFSFTNISGVPNTPWNWVGFDNYASFFSLSGAGRDNLGVLTRTIIFCIAVTLIQNGVALFMAVLVNSRPLGHLFFRSLFFMPTILGVTIIGLIWNLLFNPLEGPIQKLWNVFGQSSEFLGSPSSAFPLVIFVQIWQNMGFSLVIFLAGLQSISRDWLDAARVDGASPWQTFRHVTFPLLSSSVTTNVLLAIIGSLQTYQLIYVLTGGQFETSTLALQVFKIGFQGSISGGGLSRVSQVQQGYAASIAMIQFAFILVVALGSQWYLRRRETQI
ncbi:MAG: sugar transporter permease [Chloroflexi bacterium]|nr:sugar transporter permease [Chloroflexota bacterium]